MTSLSKVRMGEAVRLRLEGWTRPLLEKHLSTLAKAVRHLIKPCPGAVGGPAWFNVGQWA